MLVLTYHSISTESGPTSIAPEIFRMQMDVLAECGYRGADCGQYLAWCDEGPGGRAAGAVRRVLITFDDGYADFATTAFPILRDRGFSAIVFVPTGKLGGREDWRGANVPARPLLSWPTVVELARAGVEFGGHGVTHTDLTGLGPEGRRDEIDRCALELRERTGRAVRAFAAPYGRVNPEVLADLARTYEVAFGTRFDRARPTGNRFDVPRIEMHYFRRRRHWAGFVQGDRGYFLTRRILRAGRAAGMRLLNHGGTAG